MVEQADHNGRVERYRKLALQPPRVTILGDNPLFEGKPHLDSFELNFRLGPIYDVLRHPMTPTPMAVAIYGGWGTGKTSAMKWLDGQLNQWNREGDDPNNDKVDVYPVWFYPWKYHSKEDVWRGLIAEVILKSVSVGDATPTRVRDAAKRFGIFLGRSFLDALSHIKLKAGAKAGPQVEVSGALFSDIFEEFQKVNRPEKAYLNQFEYTLTHWVAHTLGDRERIVIFIDDLDRCMPDVALQVLEALKLYLNIPKLIFVLGLDRQVIDDMVKKYYEDLGVGSDKARKYLDKMFQLEVTLDPSQQQIEQYLERHLASINLWSDQVHFTDAQRKIFSRIILDLAGRNPREVKRLVGSALSLAAGTLFPLDPDQKSGDRLTFAQGFQIFFLKKILAEPRYNLASMAGSRRGDEFFRKWSAVVRDSGADVPTSFPVPESMVETLAGAKARKPYENEEATKNLVDQWLGRYVPEAYRGMCEDLSCVNYLRLFADRNLGELMRIEYPRSSETIEEAAGSISSLQLIREAIARYCGKTPEQIDEEEILLTTKLDLSGARISELDSIKPMVKLTHLILAATQIHDVKPLQYLTDLESLNLSHTSVSDLEPLARLQKLKTLNISATKVTDFSPLQAMVQLVDISLSRTLISKLEVLRGLAKLKSLILSRTSVTDLEPIRDAKELRYLDLRDTPIVTLRPINDLNQLEHLDLRGSRVQNLEPLRRLTRIKYLNILETRVRDLNPIKNLSKLERLYLNRSHYSEEHLDTLRKFLPVVQIVS